MQPTKLLLQTTFESTLKLLATTWSASVGPPQSNFRGPRRANFREIVAAIGLTKDIQEMSEQQRSRSVDVHTRRVAQSVFRSRTRFAARGVTKLVRTTPTDVELGTSSVDSRPKLADSGPNLAEIGRHPTSIVLIRPNFGQFWGKFRPTSAMLADIVQHRLKFGRTRSKVGPNNDKFGPISIDV